MFVHGALDRSAGFVRVARELPAFTRIRYDRRGYGRSRALAASDRFGDQVDDLAVVVDEQPTVVLGHSFGGVIALALAAGRPDLVRAVVAYEAPMSWTAWWPGASAGAAAVEGAADPADAAERFMRRMIGDARWEALPDRTRSDRRAEGPALLADLRAIRPPAPAPYEAANLTMPVIAACGSESRPHHRRAVQTLADMAPRGELAVVEGAGHGAHTSHAAALADLVRLALARSVA